MDEGFAAAAQEVVRRLLISGAEAPGRDLDIDDLAAEVAERLGFRGVCYYQLSTGGDPIEPKPIFGLDNPAWHEFYMQSNYQHYDPIIQSVFRSAFPFTMSEQELIKHDAMSQRVFDDRRVMRSQDSLFCPIFAPLGGRGCLIFLADTPIEMSPELRFYAKGIADILVSIHWQNTEPDVRLDGPWPSLTRREAECLYWLSQGKSATDTAAILGLSQHTVRDYIYSIMEKLSARSREEMILRALPLGLLISHR